MITVARPSKLDLSQKGNITPLPVPPTPALETLLTIAEVQGILRVGREQLYRLIDKEGLPIVPMGANRRRVRPSSLAQWVANREETAKGIEEE